ncbi:hypothetical protein VKT23_009939 [Stygiomarasmius scandens]|uniref:F-box domain-containing protein n=1 Tax=Marasmiellus scandens TaxID=2682957 RepID=A0ABR1JCK0_9AGAR
MQNCSWAQHATLLRVSRRFYELGIASLYCSVWIISTNALARLARTLREPSGTKLALKVKSFKLALNEHQIRHEVYEDLRFILRCVGNIRRLQLYFEDILFGDRGRLIGNHTYSILQEFTISVPTQDFVLSLFKFLRQHRHLLNLNLLIPDKHYFTSDEISGKVEPISLPALRSYRGPILVLKYLIDGARSLSSIIINAHEEGPYKVADLRSLLKLEGRASISSEFEPRNSMDVVPAERLGFEIVLPPSDLYILEIIVCFLPSDLETFSIRLSFFDKNLENLASTSIPEKFGLQMPELPRLKTFMVNCYSTHDTLNMLEFSMPEQLIEKISGSGANHSSLEYVVFCGRHFRREAKNVHKWVPVRI